MQDGPSICIFAVYVGTPGKQMAFMIQKLTLIIKIIATININSILCKPEFCCYHPRKQEQNISYKASHFQSRLRQSQGYNRVKVIVTELQAPWKLESFQGEGKIHRSVH